MKKINKPSIWNICIIIGAIFIVAGAAVLLIWQASISSFEKKAKNYAGILAAIIPEPQGAVLEERRDNTMATLSLDGVDFVGILEMPRYESALPVCSEWGNSLKYPCKFNGSIYDKSMQIGATSQKGQYDFYREISVGDSLVFTDVEGNRYTYSVTNLRYEKHANQTTLNKQDAELTLFIKNVYDFEYLVVSCNISK